MGFPLAAVISFPSLGACLRQPAQRTVWEKELWVWTLTVAIPTGVMRGGRLAKKILGRTLEGIPDTFLLP